MDWPALLLKLAHVALAMIFVAGLAGRWVVLRAAEQSDEIGRTDSLLKAAEPFERTVRISSILVVVAGLLTAWAQGYDWLGLTTGWMLASVAIFVVIGLLIPTVFLPRGAWFAEALEGARSEGRVTDRLRAAFADPAVRAAHWAEGVAVAAIVALMVLKPF
jgi:uncharacterized membrane protein